MTKKIDYEKKYKKLKRAVKKFLGGYIWANCDMAEDQGYGIGFMDADKPEHVKQVDKIYEIMNKK